MDFGDSLITAFVILLFSIIITIFPLLITANHLDSASQATLQTQMTDFVNQIWDTGKITKDEYDKFEEIINGPNSYNIEIDVKVLDENPTKEIIQRNEQNGGNNQGENVYVTYYTSQILEQLDKNGVLLLKEGDQVHISIVNTNKTMAQQLASPINVDISTIIAETTQVCTINGI